jgi:DNA-binding beta-propeller fold protein YncE
MKAPRRTLGAAAIPAVLLASLVAGPAGAADTAVVASGLNNPRGIDVGANGRVYIAEAGTGRILRLVAGGIAVVAGGLPSEEVMEGELSGPVNVAGTGNGNVFALIGAGPRDVDDRFATVRRVTGVKREITDIHHYQATDPDPFDTEGLPHDSNPYGLEAIGAGRLLVTDAANNDLLVVKSNGRTRTVARFPLHVVSTSHLPMPNLPPELPAEVVPTTVAVGPDGYWYVGELTGFPFAPGASRIWRIAPWARNATCDSDTSDGCALYLDGFTSITGLDFGPDGSLYVVEIVKDGVFNLFSGGDPTGALIRVKDGVRSELAAGQLIAPADVAVGRDGTVYVTNKSVMPDGEVIAIRP